MNTFIKQIKLIDSRKAVVKTKWSEDKIEYYIFVENETGEWTMYYNKSDYETFQDQCKKFKVPENDVKRCFTEKNDQLEIIYKFDSSKMKFTVLMREMSDSIGEIDHPYTFVYVKEADLTVKSVMNLVLEMEELCNKCKEQASALERLNAEFESVSKSSLGLIEKHNLSNQKLLENFILLLNSKKSAPRNDVKFIANTSTDNESDKQETNLVYLTKNVHKTPVKVATEETKKRTPKRTPSKFLQRVQLQMTSDSESEGVGIIRKATIEENKQSMSSKSVFGDLKLTPIEVERARESSIELKISKKRKAQKSESSESESSGNERRKSQFADEDNAQKMWPSSSASSSDDQKPRTNREHVESSSNTEQDDPYAQETVNILNDETV